MSNTLLGSYTISHSSFENLDTIFQEFHHKEFIKLSARKKFKRINKTLLDLILSANEPCFLLPQVLEFIERVNKEKILHEHFSITSFEFWLNHFSQLIPEENLRVRSRITGKYIPRDEYQTFFPIGMGKMFTGSHFVVAHFSPDVDTTIASFWGWIDAFSARVAEGLHYWNMPNEPADAHTLSFFQDFLGKSFFALSARKSRSLTLTAQDLVNEKNFVKIPIHTRLSNLEHNHSNKAIILVDEEGHFISDWRPSDTEVIRQVGMTFNTCIRWFESFVHTRLISLFAKRFVSKEEIAKTLNSILALHVKDSDPAKEFTEKQRRIQNDYLKKVLNISKGISASFHEVMVELDPKLQNSFASFTSTLHSLLDAELFDTENRLREDFEKIFSRLEKIIHTLTHAMLTFRFYVDQLDIMIAIKEKVLGYPNYSITLKSDIEEIKSKISTLGHLTVVIPEEEGKWFPVGVVQEHDVQKSVLGTVSLRDFSNENETDMAGYLQVISVVDHHKVDLKTATAPTFIIADAQSSNTLIAERTIALNKRYSTMGIALDTIEKDLEELANTLYENEETFLRRQQRLIQLKLLVKKQQPYFVHPQREFLEYFSFLTAILDDTDLLSKVSRIDVECIVQLLNRMKSIAIQQDVEIVSLDDIPRDEHFARAAADRILQNHDMHSIYKSIFSLREREVENSIQTAKTRSSQAFFADTKEQNGCCRIGQTKIFNSSYSLFKKYATDMYQLWYENAQKVYENNPVIDLHMHMISTIPNADDVFYGSSAWNHQDELWFWVPEQPIAYEHLIIFLNGLQSYQVIQNNMFDVEFFGKNWMELEKVFANHFPRATRKKTVLSEKDLPIAILRFKAGLLNSRKAAITPYLPRYVT